MQKNEIITLTIESITSEASGVGRYAGFVVFVPYTAVGDVAEVKVLKVAKNYAYGRLERLITPSPDRIENDCPAFLKCGGCDYRHISYEAELRAKEQCVKDAFERLGSVGKDVEFLPIIGTQDTARYRNKAQYPIRHSVKSDVKAEWGFYRSHSHDVVPCSDCKLQPELFGKIMTKAMEFVNGSKISIYNEETGEGVLRHIQLRTGHYSHEILVTIIAKRNVPEFKPLARMLAASFPEIVGIVVNINKARTNVVLGFDNEDKTLFGRDYLTDTMCGNEIEVSSRTFYQVNTKAAETIYRIAEEFLQPEGKTVLDLYCGVGTISLMLAKTAKSVHGIDIIPQSIENAKRNAEKNGVENVSFYAGDVFDGLGGFSAPSGKIDGIVLDPARKGCERRTLERVAALQAERIVMVSCNPATAARDCAVLGELGYEVKRVQAVDLFARTGHVECVTFLSHKKADDFIRIKMDFERVETIPAKITYQDIQEYIEETYGLKVHSANIAEVKRCMGLPVNDAPNAVQELRHPKKHVTPEKADAIKNALEHFKIIQI